MLQTSFQQQTAAHQQQQQQQRHHHPLTSSSASSTHNHQQQQPSFHGGGSSSAYSTSSVASAQSSTSPQQLMMKDELASNPATSDDGLAETKNLHEKGNDTGCNEYASDVKKDRSGVKVRGTVGSATGEDLNDDGRKSKRLDNVDSENNADMTDSHMAGMEVLTTAGGTKRTAPEMGDDDDSDREYRSKYRRVDDHDHPDLVAERSPGLISDVEKHPGNYVSGTSLPPSADRVDRRNGELMSGLDSNGDDDDDDSNEEARTPSQHQASMQIKTQRPLGLLAQHRLLTPSSSSASLHSPSGNAAIGRSQIVNGDDSGTIDLSRRAASIYENFGLMTSASIEGASDNENGRQAATRRQASTADVSNDVYDDESVNDVDDDDIDRESILSNDYQRRLPSNTNTQSAVAAGIMAANAAAAAAAAQQMAKFYAGSGVLPSTPTSGGLLVGLDYSMHRQQQQQLQQLGLHHQFQQQQARFESLMDRRFMPSPPLPMHGQHRQPSHSPGSSGGTTSLGGGRDDACSPSSACGSSGGAPSSPSGHQRQWSFQEQFKQLYEMSDDVKRKEFLDELFSFMQKRGTPVNRIPIMAKQTLDLYELFRLVVSKGGLVEVINKKLWREITKGLNLPSSITSAAFTLRTQYMKYLYPFECEKLKLSTLAELQYAVDGNRREGRRPSYCGGPGDYSPLPVHQVTSMPNTGLTPCTPPGLHPAHLVGAAPPGGAPHLAGLPPGATGLPPQLPPGAAAAFNVDGINAAAMAAAAAAMAARVNCLGQLIHQGVAARNQDGMAASLDQRHMVAAAAAAAAAENQLRAGHQSQIHQQHLTASVGCDTSKHNDDVINRSSSMMDSVARTADAATPVAHDMKPSATCPIKLQVSGAGGSEVKVSPLAGSTPTMIMDHGRSSASPVSKRPSSPQMASTIRSSSSAHPAVEDSNNCNVPPIGPFPGHMMLPGRGGVGSAHIKLTNRNNGRNEFDPSIMASMEINGIIYQGVLFAQTPLSLFTGRM